LEKVIRKKPALILLDMNIPIMNGYQFLAALKKENINTRVIAQTAYVMPEEKDAAFSLLQRLYFKAHY
jgi:CheY-like chemotaxis protein